MTSPSTEFDSTRILGSRAVADAASRTWDGESRSLVVDTDGHAVAPGPYNLVTTLVQVLAVGQRHDLTPGGQGVLLVHVVTPLPGP